MRNNIYAHNIICATIYNNTMRNVIYDICTIIYIQYSVRIYMYNII